MTNGTQRSLGRIEQKVDGVVKQLDTMNILMTDHSEKIDLLQTYKDTAIGEVKGREKEQRRAAGTFGAVAGGFVTIVAWVATKLFSK